jgi:hypothetical protein
MNAEQEKQLEALFAAGDPGRRVSELLPQRVAARLDAPRRSPALLWARHAVVGLTLVSSVGLGAVAVWASNEARKALAPPPAELRAVKPATVKHAPPAQVDPLTEEAALLQESLEALQRGDADLALVKLEQRARRFPSGLLESEAGVARLKALLLAHRDAEALERFAALPQSDLTLPLRLTWADLLVRHGRCPEALSVLAGVEGSDVAASLKARCAR